MQEFFYIVCLAVGFGLDWYMKREKLREAQETARETMERVKRIEESARKRTVELEAFVNRIAGICEGLGNILQDDPTVYSRAINGEIVNSKRESRLDDKVKELERELERVAELWLIELDI
jgi:hypothetical protein